MTSEKWTLVKAVFSEALEIDPHQRDQWLRDRAELPSAVAAEVFRLLAASESVTGLAAPLSGAEIPVGAPGQLVGLTLLSRFEVVSLLGSGAMGDVYCAFDRSVNEAVAFKTIRPHLAQRPELISSLTREVALARRVVHANICQIRDLHHEPNPPAGPLLFFTMELLPGRTLAAQLAERALTIPETLEIARGIAAGIDAIHSRSLIHRDLKPSNVFLVRSESQSLRAVITDFGLCFDQSRAVAETLSAFGPDAVVGTPAYMAPEQLLGKGATQQSDIYAFGVLLFEMVTGQLPFAGETPLAIALRRLQQDAPDARSLVKNLHAKWNAVIAACLQRDPARRPASALDVIAALEGTGKLPAAAISRRALIAGGVAASLTGVSVIWRSRSAQSHISPDAEHHVRLAQASLSQVTSDGIISGIAELKLALKIDPHYASAWAELADAYCLASTYAVIASKKSLPLALSAAQQALAIDTRLGKAWGAYAYVQGCDLNNWPSAEATFRKALAFDPACATSYSWFAGFLGRSCRFSEAVDMANKALYIEPGSIGFSYRLGTELFRGRRFAELKALMLACVKRQRSASGYCMLARAYEWLKQFDQANEALKYADLLGNHAANQNFWATYYAAQGRLKEAQAESDAIGDGWRRQVQETNVYLYTLGALYMARPNDGLMDSIADVMKEAVRRKDETILGAASNLYIQPIRSHAKLKPLFEQLQLPVA